MAISLKTTRSKGTKYYAIVENKRVPGRKNPVTETLFYIGRIDNLLELVELKTALDQGLENCIEIPTDVEHGPGAALWAFANELGLPAIIDELVPKSRGLRAGENVTMLAINRLIDPQAKMGIREWIEQTSLPMITDIQVEMLNAETICHLLDYLTEDVCLAIDRARFEKIDAISHKGIAHFDTTSSYTYGHCNEFAKRGYSRDRRPDLEQVNWSVVIDQNQVPLTMQMYAGNLNDVSQCVPSIAKFKSEVGISDFTLVFDRGNVSERNIQEIVGEMGFHVICTMRVRDKVTREAIEAARNLPQKVLKKIRTENGEKTDVMGASVIMPVYGELRKIVVCFNESTFNTRRHNREKNLKRAERGLEQLWVSMDTTIFSIEEAEQKIEIILKPVKKLIRARLSHEGLHTSFDYELIDKGVTRGDKWEREKVRRRLERFQIQLATRKRRRAKRDYIEQKLSQLLEKCPGWFETEIIEKECELTVNWERNGDAIARSEKWDGWYVLMSSNTEASDEEIVSAYSQQDAIEKCFRTIKSPIKVRPLNHHKGDRVRAHIWICVLAHVIEKLFMLKLKQMEPDLAKELTFSRVMKILRPIRRVKMQLEIGGITKESWKTTNLTDEQTRLLAVASAVVPQ